MYRHKHAKITGELDQWNIILHHELQTQANETMVHFEKCRECVTQWNQMKEKKRRARDGEKGVIDKVHAIICTFLCNRRQDGRTANDDRICEHTKHRIACTYGR